MNSTSFIYKNMQNFKLGNQIIDTNKFVSVLPLSLKFYTITLWNSHSLSVKCKVGF